MGMDKSHLNPLILFLYLQIDLCISLNHMKLLFGHVLLNKKFTVLLRESVNKPTTSGRTHDCAIDYLSSSVVNPQSLADAALAPVPSRK